MVLKSRFSMAAALRGVSAVGLLLCASAGSYPLARAEEPKFLQSTPTSIAGAIHSHDDVRHHFIHGAFSLQDAAGNTLGSRWIGSAEPPPLSERDVVAALAGHVLSASDAAALWEMLAGELHAPFLTLPLIDAAVAATVGPLAREAMWGELAALSDRLPRESVPARNNSLVGLFERHQAELRVRFTAIADTIGAGDEMVKLMLATQIFGAALQERVAFLASINPSALDRRIERDRSAGKPITWQSYALPLLAAWHEARRTDEGATSPPPLSDEENRHRFIHGAFSLFDANGDKRGERHVGDAPLLPLSEPAVVKALTGHQLSAEDAAALWEMLAGEEHAPLLTLPMLKAVVAATVTPRAREALWSELSSLTARLATNARMPAPAASLLDLFERHAGDLQPLITEGRETEGGGDEMVKLMLASRVFGADLQ